MYPSFQGIEGASETLEQLWISYNQIDRMKPIRSLQRLKVIENTFAFRIRFSSLCFNVLSGFVYGSQLCSRMERI